MKVLITPKLTLRPSNKKGQYQVTVELTKKNTNELIIRCASHNRKDKRILGVIDRYGQHRLKGTPYCKGVTQLISINRNKIDTVLDLVFGVQRDKFPTFNKYGQTEFKK
jgi:hypothetical protein